MAHRRGNWSSWYDAHPAIDHESQLGAEGGFLMLVCTTCGVYQSAAELEAGIAPVSLEVKS